MYTFIKINNYYYFEIRNNKLLLNFKKRTNYF